MEPHFTIAVLVLWILTDAIINWMDQDPAADKDMTKVARRDRPFKKK